MDAEGRRHSRDIQRKINLEAMRAEAEQQLEEQIRYELENPDAQTKAALAVAEADYEASVQKEIANQQYRVTEQQRADHVARELIAEQDQEAAGITDASHMVSPDLQSTEDLGPEEWQPSAPKLRRRYVKRGSVYRRAKDSSVKLRTGERVFVREKGHYQEIGVVEPGNTLPIVYMEDQL